MHPKIDIYCNNEYVCSTVKYDTCKNALRSYLEKYKVKNKDISSYKAYLHE